MDSVANISSYEVHCYAFFLTESRSDPIASHVITVNPRYNGLIRGHSARYRRNPL